MLGPLKEVLNDNMYSLYLGFTYDPIVHLPTDILQEDSWYLNILNMVIPMANADSFTTAGMDNIENNWSSTSDLQSSNKEQNSNISEFFPSNFVNS